MRYTIIILLILFGSAPAANAQLSIGIGVPGVSIGIDLPVYPEFVQVPGYPVYYAPRLRSNYFFYDGMYWVYQNDNWYASSWYNGPWGMVGPQYVPVFVLRVPVRYYRQPPTYFLSWQADAPPLWGSHWGNEWEQQRSGWDQWDRSAMPALAPLPVYQQQYLGDRYPSSIDQQHELHNQNYSYQPSDSVVQQYYKERVGRKAAAATRQEQLAPQQRGPREQDIRDSSPQRSEGERREQLSPIQDARPQSGAAVEDQRQSPQQQERDKPEQGSPDANRENVKSGKAASQGQRDEQNEEQGREKDQERGQKRAQEGGR